METLQIQELKDSQDRQEHRESKDLLSGQVLQERREQME
jgi:hypothetical protein